MVAKYDPLNINYSILPKQWLNTPIMSFEEAQMEEEKLRQAELSNAQGEQNVERLTRENDASEGLKKAYEEAQAARIAAGQDDIVPVEDALKMARKYQIAAGQGNQLANDILQQENSKAVREEAAKRSNAPKIVGYSDQSTIYSVDPNTGEMQVIRKGIPKPDKEKPEKPLTKKQQLEDYFAGQMLDKFGLSEPSEIPNPSGGKKEETSPKQTKKKQVIVYPKK